MSDHPRDLTRDEKLLPELGGNERIATILLRWLGPGELRPSSLSENRRGVDRWWARELGRPLSVELKCRREEWTDLCVEWVSADHPGAPGWSVDLAKISDYLLYLFPNTSRLLPFSLFRSAAIDNREMWQRKYPHSGAPTTTDGRYETLWSPVPDAVVLAAMGRPATVRYARSPDWLDF